MPIYNLYAGLGGGFGGAIYQYSAPFHTYEEAEAEARGLAIEEYESYEGHHGLRSYSEVEDDYIEENEIDSRDNLTEEDLENIYEEYLEEVESWIDYSAILDAEDDNLTPEEFDLHG